MALRGPLGKFCKEGGKKCIGIRCNNLRPFQEAFSHTRPNVKILSTTKGVLITCGE